MNNSLSQATNGLLMQLVMDLKSGYLRRCESLGLAREEMQMLQGLTIEEIHYLSNSEVSVTRTRVRECAPDYEYAAGNKTSRGDLPGFPGR